MSFPDLIPNASLRSEDIPGPETEWRWPGIQAFALTFDGYDYGFKIGDDVPLGGDYGSFTLSEIRAYLFLLQRKWRHMEYFPNDQELLEVRRMLDTMRLKVESGQVE